MRRNMDLIRKLLLELEGEEEVDLSEFSREEVDYHKYLIIDAGLALGDVSRTTASLYPEGYIVDLTWAGHDFLDAAKDDSRWKKAVYAAGPVSFEVLKKVLTELAIASTKSKLGLP